MICDAEKAYRQAKNRREFNEKVVEFYRASGLKPDDFVRRQEPFVTRLGIDPTVIPGLIERA